MSSVILQREIGVSQRSFSAALRTDSNMSPADFAEGWASVLRVANCLGRRKHEGRRCRCGFGALRCKDRALTRLPTTPPGEFRSRFKTHGGDACRPST